MDENNTSGMKIVKRSGEEVSFDTSKIAEAISSSMHIIDLFAGAGGLLEGLREALSIFAERVSAIVSSIVEKSKDFFISFLDRMREIFQNLKNKRKERRHPRPVHALIVARILIICVRHFTVGFLEFFPEIRMTYLLRSQDRSSSDAENNVEYMYVTC